jgi:TorA maturation chaperone TorD
MRATTPDAAASEYEALFGGVGKPEVFLYGSYYLAGFLNEMPLALLRADLATLGLAGEETRGETEDHVACVFEVMRYLIAGDDAALSNLEQQRRFFRAHVQPWVERLADAVEAQPRAALWRQVAGLTRAFILVETQAFDMLE